MDLLQCTASLPGGSGQMNSCNRLPHCLGAVGSGAFRNALPHCLGAVGIGTPAMHCLTAWGQWAVELLLYTASLPGGSGQWTSCNILPHCPGATGGGPPAMHCPTAWGQWAVDLLQCTASPLGGSGQWKSCNALPHCLGAGGGGGGGAPAVVPRTVSRGVVPRGPHAGSAEAVLRLTSARVRRISSHT